MPPKSSQAVQWWLSVLVSVLALLFVQTQGKWDPGSNFVVNTSAGAIGAQIYIDGKMVGLVEAVDLAGVRGGAFWWHLSRGKHLLTLRKAGFKSFSCAIEMQGEDYLGVDLTPEKN